MSAALLLQTAMTSDVLLNASQYGGFAPKNIAEPGADMLLDLALLRQAQVTPTPFPYMYVPGILSASSLHDILSDFPRITAPGVFPLSDLSYSGHFTQLVEEIRSSALQALLEQKFDMQLAGRPLMVTVRGQCQRKDGRIHADSKDKLLTCLLYLNPPHWEAEGGRLRLLRSPDDLEDMITEIPPAGGTFVAFRRSENAWHGHHPFVGARRILMFNWLTSNAAYLKNIGRHKLSAAFKGIGASYAD